MYNPTDAESSGRESSVAKAKVREELMEGRKANLDSAGRWASEEPLHNTGLGTPF